MKLLLCFLPIIIVWLLLKFVLLFEESYGEYDYVRRESKKPHGPYVEDPYGDIDEEEESD